MAHPSDPDRTTDPVRARRERVAHWTLLANRVGYLVLALAVTLFFLAFLFGFTPTMATLIVVTLVVSFVLLAPSIVLGYAVKAAERDDVEHGY
jgi:hypothetical protein